MEQVRVVETKALNVEAYVKEYFKDIPIMAKIARCESGYRQWDKNGDVLRGVQNSLDKGVMQINEKYHLAASKRLGYDLSTLEGNLAYARHLYTQEGTRPWFWSKGCWGQTSP